MARASGWTIACGVLLSSSTALAQTNTKQPSYETVFFPSGKLKIEAYVFKPEGAGPFPVVIYNHGSRPEHERDERPFAYVGEMLSHSGYVVVVPERRGYGKSDGPTFSETVGEDRGPRFVTRVQEETDDMLAAVEFVKTLPYADMKRMAVMGWSFGGIVSVFGASRSTAFRAAVDQAGAALTWEHSPAMQAALKEAGGRIRIPLLGMVAKNGPHDRICESRGARSGSTRLHSEADCVPGLQAARCGRRGSRPHDFWKGGLEDLGTGRGGVSSEVGDRTVKEARRLAPVQRKQAIAGRGRGAS